MKRGCEEENLPPLNQAIDGGGISDIVNKKNDTNIPRRDDIFETCGDLDVFREDKRADGVSDYDRRASFNTER